MAVVGSLVVLIAGNSAPLMASLAKSEAAMRGFASGTVTSTSLIKTALAGIGIGAAVGAVAAVNAAADFEDAFAGVRKTVDEADLTAAGMSFESLAQVFRTMATEIPVAATELAAIGETAGALGIRAADIEAFTRTVALLGATTDLSTGAAAEALGKVGTILGLTGGEFKDFADILVNLGNKGASTESEIIEITKRFAAAGQAAGLTTPEILAFSSAIASAGVRPEAAGGSLSRLFGNIVEGAANATSAGKAFAKTTGMAFGDFSKLVETDTVGAMLLVLESLKGLDKFGQEQALMAMGITATRDVSAIRALAQTYETNLIPALGNAGAAAGALTTEAEKRFATFSVQLTLLGNTLNELGITLGTALLPPLTTLTQTITGAVQSVSAWAAANPALSSSLLPVIAGVALLGLGVAVLGAPFVALIAIITLVMLNLDALGRGIQVVIDTITRMIELAKIGADAVAGIPGVKPVAQTVGGLARAATGQFGPTIEAQTFMAQFEAQNGRRATPLDFAAWQRGGSQPIQINNNTTVVLDGQKVGEINDRRLFNSASQASSGFNRGALEY